MTYLSKGEVVGPCSFEVFYSYYSCQLLLLKHDEVKALRISENEAYLAVRKVRSVCSVQTRSEFRAFKREERILIQGVERMSI